MNQTTSLPLWTVISSDRRNTSNVGICIYGISADSGKRECTGRPGGKRWEGFGQSFAQVAWKRFTEKVTSVQRRKQRGIWSLLVAGGVLTTEVTSAEALLWAVPSQDAEFRVLILFPSLTAGYSACLHLWNSPRLTGRLTNEAQGMSSLSLLIWVLG